MLSRSRWIGSGYRADTGNSGTVASHRTVEAAVMSVRRVIMARKICGGKRGEMVEDAELARFTNMSS